MYSSCVLGCSDCVFPLCTVLVTVYSSYILSVLCLFILAVY